MESRWEGEGGSIGPLHPGATLFESMPFVKLHMFLVFTFFGIIMHIKLCNNSAMVEFLYV